MMGQNVERQFRIIEGVIRAYHAKQISLDKLIQRIEGASEFIGMPSWKDGIFPYLLELEQINAVALDAQTSPSPDQKADILSALKGIGGLIDQIRKS